MRWTRWIGAACGAGIAGGALFVGSCAAPPAQEAAMTPAEMIARGKVVSYTSGCQDCHTPGALYGAPDSTRELSGSDLGWQGPWGVTYPRNLTPDSTTGIGAWTEDQIVTAIRQGHRPDGSPILPPMPWPGFSRFSDRDVRALAAYLKSLPPVSHAVPSVLPPGAKVSGPLIVIPAPPPWDAQNLPMSNEGGAPPEEEEGDSR
jgi:mono/diheme cytochrome c family protein